MSNKEKFSNLLKFGINLELKSEEEHLFYAQCFTSWVMQQEHFDASMASDTEIEIYFYAEMVLLVSIEEGTLLLDPASEDCFEAVLIVLRFVSERHEMVKKEFKKLNTDSIIGEMFYNDIGIQDEQEDSEDDSEWI